MGASVSTDLFGPVLTKKQIEEKQTLYHDFKWLLGAIPYHRAGNDYQRSFVIFEVDHIRRNLDKLGGLAGVW